ncbi:unnamed protein product [Brassica rapa subsp. trilocularis]
MRINKCTCEFKQHHILHGKESVQEKRIFSQENKIQRLNYQVQDLRRQLVQCRNENQVKLTELVTELDQLPLQGFAMREAIKKINAIGIFGV